jgi:hypothetical protein
MVKKTLRYSKPALHSVSGPGTCACVSGSAAGASSWSCVAGPTIGTACNAGAAAGAACNAGATAVYNGVSACVFGGIAVGTAKACSGGGTAANTAAGNACLVGAGV